MPGTRRHFLKSATTLLASAQAATASRGASPNDRIRFAAIGFGERGLADTRQALAVPGVELAAVCDLYEGRRTRARELYGNALFTTVDYRDVLARRDVDAVIVATADHWHAPITTDALAAGKDVYCEKPMVHSLPEGKVVIDAQARAGRILQIGSQRVSSIVYQKAKELIRAGAIGEPNLIEACWDRNNELMAFASSIPPDASPATVGWKRFIAKSSDRPYDGRRFFQWRGYQEYGEGVAGDLFVHLFSGVHFVLDSLGPVKVYATGGIRFWKDGRDMPDLMLGLYDYPQTSKCPPLNLALRMNFENGSVEKQEFHFVGTEGILTISHGVQVAKRPREREPGYSIDNFPARVQKEFLRQYREKYPAPAVSTAGMTADTIEEFLPPRGYNDHYAHMANFFHAVRTRQPVIEDAIFGFRAAAPALLSNLSWSQGRTCNWDPVSMRQV
jgi:predicted dehydrogenase